MQVHISKGNTKMGVIPSVSLLPPDSCGPDVPCKKDCYACRLLKTRKTWRATLEKNLAVCRKDMLCYFHEVRRFLRTEAPKMFRWHVAGDILNVDYLHCMIWMAHWCPKIKFLCFTKRRDLLTVGMHVWAITHPEAPRIPNNLRIVISRWPGDNDVSKYLGDEYPQAWISTDPRAPAPGKGVFACPGRCDACGKCWNLKPGQHIVLAKH